jgi:hypothetical protein
MMHDELLGVECHRITSAALSDWDVVQQLDGRWIKAEEVQSPSISATAFYPIEEGSVASFQQVASNALKMTPADQRLACQSIGEHSRA